MSLQVTSRAFTTARTKPTFSEFNTTSNTFVDVTGAVGSSLPDGHTEGFQTFGKTNGGGNCIVREVNTALTFLSTTDSTASSSFVVLQAGGTVNALGSPQALKLQARQDVGTSLDIQLDSYVSCTAPLTSLTDLFIKASVSKCRIWSFGTNDGILGRKPNAPNDLDFLEFDIDSLVNSFIWSANSGDVLFDYSGNSIEVIP